MRTALWETSTGALATLLNARGPIVKADLYTITLVDGTVYRYSGTDVAIAGNSLVWTKGPIITRSSVRFVVGMEVDSMTLQLFGEGPDGAIPGSAYYPTGLDFDLRDIWRGVLYGARVQVDKAFWPPGATVPTGALKWFEGRVSDWEVSRHGATIHVRSDLELLDVMVPRDVYQQGCLNTLYDAACGLSRATLAVTGTVPSDSASHPVTFAHGLANPAGYFDLGVVTFDGAASNPNQSRTIKSYDAVNVTVLRPFDSRIRTGDNFTMWPGCDKQRSTCIAKFGNLPRFRGMPFIPVPETVT